MNVAHLYKRFGDKVVLEDVSLTVPDGAVVCLMAPSGRGKTTLLRCIAGLEMPDSGTVTGVPERLGFVFQEDRLCPQLDAVENVRLVTGRAMSRPDIEAHLRELGLADCLDQRAAELSGGQRRRVSVARAVCYVPELLLLDEPFSALDYQQRLLLADEVHSIIKRGGYTAVLVTHDISEAICMSDRVIILSERPARIRKQVELNMGSDTPLERRSNPLFREYYDAVWSEFRLAGERQQLMPTENANTQKGV